MVRRSDGAALVQALVLIAIVTILVTRAYLAATGYPQIGGKTLHIAHSLWGGAAMIIALVLLLSFTGRRSRTAAVVAGGIGLGLFLDEVGKFVTKTNDYFFAPSVAIMYVVLVILLLANRLIQDVVPRNPAGDLVEGLARTGEALSGGVTTAERAEITALLDSAAAGDTDPAAISEVAGLLAQAPQRPPGRLARLRERLLPADRERTVGAGTTLVVAVLLTLFSVAGLVSAAVTIGDDVSRGDGVAIVAAGQFGGSILASVLCLTGLVLLILGRGGLWPLRILRAAALVTMLLTEVFDFVAVQFGALINVAVGLLALAVFSYRIRYCSNPANTVSRIRSQSAR